MNWRQRNHRRLFRFALMAIMAAAGPLCHANGIALQRRVTGRPSKVMGAAEYKNDGSYNADGGVRSWCSFLKQ